MAQTESHPHANYTMMLADGRIVDVLPTPGLLEAASRQRMVEAYQTDAATERYPAQWRLRDDNYDPAGTEYSRVYAIVQKAGR
jgi:hypothetical protein